MMKCQLSQPAEAVPSKDKLDDEQVDYYQFENSYIESEEISALWMVLHHCKYKL